MNVVTFTWATWVTEPDIAALVDELAALPGPVPALSSYRFGSNVGLRPGGGDFAIVAVVPNRTASLPTSTTRATCEWLDGCDTWPVLGPPSRSRSWTDGQPQPSVRLDPCHDARRVHVGHLCAVAGDPGVTSRSRSRDVARV